jgi:hypothetical protein
MWFFRYYTGKANDRVVILVIGKSLIDYPKILGIPIIPRSTRQEQTTALVEVLNDWNCL